MANLALADEGAGAGADLAELALARRVIGDRRPLELRPGLNKQEKPRIRYTPTARALWVSMGTGSSGRSTDEGDEVVGDGDAWGDGEGTGACMGVSGRLWTRSRITIAHLRSDVNP